MLPEYVNPATTAIAVPECLFDKCPAVENIVGISVDIPQPTIANPMVAIAIVKSVEYIDNDGDRITAISPATASIPDALAMRSRPNC